MPKLEVADIFNKYSHYLENLPREHWKAIQAIKNCRTSVLGGNKLKCNHCEYEKVSYNSCRNRHCPKCQFTAKQKWIENRMDELLPCQYFHVVFTLPAELKPLMLRNKKASYDILFKAASQTLKEVALNPKNLGAEIGCIGVLHTWGQNLTDHPHIHFIVPGGGLKKKKKWVSCKENYLLPVQVLSKVFRGKILDFFEKAYKEDELKLMGKIEYLKSPQSFKNLLIQCAAKDFVVYSKKPFAGPEQVIKYLGGYTHRIAISNYRLVKLENEVVSFKVRDKNNPGKSKVMKLHVGEFMRRFLLHVLPKGYVRIRHFGLLGSRLKKVKIALIRKLNGITNKVKKRLEESWQSILNKVMDVDVDQCPKCSEGKLVEARTIFGLFNTA